MGWIVGVLPQKRGHFRLKIQCFITKKRSFWAEKSEFCCKEGGHFQTGEKRWVPLLPVNEGAGVICSINKYLIFNKAYYEHMLTFIACTEHNGHKSR